MSLNKKLTELQEAAIAADRERRGVALLLAAIIRKFGGRIVLTKADRDCITEATAVNTDISNLNDEITLTLGVNPANKGQLRSGRG